MSLPATDLDLPAPARRARWLVALGWGLAVGLCTGGLWAGGLLLGLWLLDVTPSAENLRSAMSPGALALAIGGGIAGLSIGECVTLVSGRSHRGAASIVLCALGALAGSVGGGLSLPVMLLCNRWLHPLTSSSLLWTALGFFVGLFGYCWSLQPWMGAEGERSTRSRRRIVAIGWGLACAACTGVPWGAALLAAQESFGLSFRTTKNVPSAVFGCAFLTGWPFGLLAGVALALRDRRDRPAKPRLLLCVICAFFGALIGVLIFLAVVTLPSLHPIASSSLAAAGTGFLAGLCGYAASRPAPRPSEEEDEDAPAGAKVEWLLRERKRDWRLPRPLLRVLPVLLTTAWALVGAALLAPSDAAIALLAVGVLGLAVAFVMFRQEERLEDLEQRIRHRREY